MSCDTNEATMKTAPIGKMRSASTFNAPAVVAASAASPRSATIHASVKPTTIWALRDTTMGHASPRSVRRLGGAWGSMRRV